MNYLVTGGAGFIGTHLCRKLISNGHKVICLDNFDDVYPKAVKINNLNELKEHPKFQLITGNVCAIDNTIDLIESKKIDSIIHIAGRGDLYSTNKNPLDFIDINTKGTLALLESMRETGLNKLIYISSSCVYGQSNVLPLLENMSIQNPSSTYAVSKQSAEKLIEMYVYKNQLNAVILRLFSVFGTNEPPESIVFQCLKANLSKQGISIHPNTDLVYDFTYISDIVDGIYLASNYLNTSKDNTFEIFNLASGLSLSKQDVLLEIENITKIKSSILHKNIFFEPANTGLANIDKAIEFLNYQPKISFSAGLKTMFDWIKSQKN